ncbi:hypothetical protein JCM8097_000779 [Rhodosporidiobolus ruineniae]
MSATRTVRSKPRLLYALPTNPPIPFPAQPSYPIAAPARDLPQAYSDALWPDTSAERSEQATLDSFARLLLALLAERTPADLNALVRALLLPLQDFDKRWRDLVPTAVEPRDEGDRPHLLPTVGSSGLSDEERAKLRSDYDRWSVQEKVRLEEEKTARKSKMTKGKGKEKAADQDGVQEDEAGEEDEEVRPHEWLTLKELLETRLQALLLLTLLSLPATFQPEPPKKAKKKKKNPEQYQETLDPAMLLDFLTDRLQIWRVMKDVSDLDVAGLGDSQEGEKTEKVQLEVERDTVQSWWQDVVEPLFRNYVDASVLAHHRLKLFPAPSQAELVAQRLAPAPSPFKARSLLSLERSARRREHEEGQKSVAESPTMKRLLSMPHLAGLGGALQPPKNLTENDIFKVPGLPLKRKDSAEQAADAGDGDSQSTAAASKDPTVRRHPRKQERPRPLPRGDSSTGGTKARDALKRREVSLGKKKSAAAVGVGGKKKAAGADDGEKDGKKRKRKSDSPRKLTAAERAAPTLTLVPDTPSKPSTASQRPNGRNPLFSRATSLPSFAALGAAFRAGTSQGSSSTLALPFARKASDSMDWERDDGDSAEEAWLEGREEDWRRKGGRERQSSYNGDEEEDAPPPIGLEKGLSTPKKARQGPTPRPPRFLPANMALGEITNTVPPSPSSAETSDASASLNMAASSPSSSSVEVPVRQVGGDGSEVHPWAGGKTILKPVEEGEKRRIRKKSGLDDLNKASDSSSTDENRPLSPTQPTGSTADLVEANQRLRLQLVKALRERDETAELLDGLRRSHAVVCAQLEATRNELGNQEDELFVLREMHEEHAKEIGELRKAKEFAEVERKLIVDEKKQLENRTTSTVAHLTNELDSTRRQLESAQQELEDGKTASNEQQEACMELLAEQKKLEAAYDEALAQLEAGKEHYEVSSGEDGAAPSDTPGASLSAEPEPFPDSSADVSQDWEKVELGELTPPRKRQALGRKKTGRFLSRRRRTPSVPLLSNPPSSNATDEVRTVKNDVEQLKQTIALLVKERSTSLDEPRSPPLPNGRDASTVHVEPA